MAGQASRDPWRQGPELNSATHKAWAKNNGICVEYIQPDKTQQSAYCESLDGSFRDECLNANWFLSLDDARQSSKIGAASATSNGCISHLAG